jgi:aryl-alcohol dehydrogenase (NADP+)
MRHFQLQLQRLTRDWNASLHRTETDEFGKTLYGEQDRPVVDAVGKIAWERGVPRAQVALAWLSRKGGVTAPIVGASKPNHLTDAVAALSLGLKPEEIAALEAPYKPHRVAGIK